jgi:hypothetical protein
VATRLLQQLVKTNTEVLNLKFADVAQLVRAGRLYRQGYGFESRHRYWEWSQ